MENYKNFIKEGNKCVHVPEENYTISNGWFYDPEILTISEFRPYYTDGRKDPTPEEYDETCMVECEGSQFDELQFPLGALYEIVPTQEETYVIYNDKVCKVIGYADDEQYVVVECGGDIVVDYSYNCPLDRDIYDLDEDELKDLRGQICVGSIYYSDYRNEYGVDPRLLLSVCDDYLEWLYEFPEVNDDNWHIYDTPQAFADFINR